MKTVQFSFAPRRRNFSLRVSSVAVGNPVLYGFNKNSFFYARIKSHYSDILVTHSVPPSLPPPLSLYMYNLESHW